MKDHRVGQHVSFGDMLNRHAMQHPDRVAIVDSTRQCTYREFNDRVSSLADALRTGGVAPGDRVAVISTNCIELLETLYAAARLGAIAVPINFRFVAGEVAHVLTDSEPSYVIVQTGFEAIVREAFSISGTTAPIAVVHDEGRGSYEELVRSGTSGADFPSVDAVRPFLLLYTSGTTGWPKGVLLDHHSFAQNVTFRALASNMSLGDEVSFVGLQLFHSGGLNPAFLVHILGGTLVVFGHESPSTEEIADVLEKWRVTMCSLVPTQWRSLVHLDGIENRRFALRRISWGAAPADDALLGRMKKVFGTLPIASVYGQTETAAGTFIAESTTGLLAGQIGRPFPHVECRVVDENMRDVPIGVAGELVYRGPSVMHGYWRNDEANREAFRGGWFHSGDLVRVDETGEFWIVGRIKELIVSGGENIYPAELERVIALHPEVKDVCVAGQPHERWGETPVAYIIPHSYQNAPTGAEIIELCRQHLASYKKPSTIVLMDEFPRNAAGKIQRFKLPAPTN